MAPPIMITVVLKTVTIPSAATAATLTFFLHIDTAVTSTTTAFDTLSVQVRNLSPVPCFNLGNVLQPEPQHQLPKVFQPAQLQGADYPDILQGGVEDSTLQTSFVLDDVNLNVTQ